MTEHELEIRDRPRANILLVDDRPENLVALAAVLEPLGENLVMAGSGEEALRELLLHEFAVILLDVQMPEMDGFAAAELIKQRERTRYVPIIFLTALSKDQAHVFRGYSAGAVDYVLKPFEPEVLRSKVAVFVELWDKNHRLLAQEERLRLQEVAEATRESEERYRRLAEAVPQIVWTAAPDGAITYHNQRWIEYTGPDAEGLAQHWTSVVHSDDLPALIALWERSLEQGTEWSTEYRLRRASDGRFRWHLVRSVPMRDEHGRVTEWVGTATDIEDQKRAQEGQRFLVEAGALLGGSLDYRKTLAELARIAVPKIADWCVVSIVEQDGSLRQLAVEHADSRMVQLVLELQERYPADPDASTGPPRVIRTGEPELVQEISDEWLEETAKDELHLELLQTLGLRSSMCVPLGTRGHVLGAITFVQAESGYSYGERDLALAEELARRAAAAVENAQLYRAAEERGRAARVLNAVDRGVFLVDEDGVIRLWNPAAESVTGLTAKQLVGRRAHDVIPGWAALEPRVPVASGPTASRAEALPLDLGDRELWLGISGVGFDEGTVYAFRDLTEERALESMKSEFVATVSHELRTPLAAIHGSALTILRPDLELGDDVRNRLLRVIGEESSRLADIVNDLLLASHLDSGRMQLRLETCDARELAANVLEAATTHLPDGISLELDAPENLAPVAADPGQLNQILANLVDNAIKYSPDGGPVRVELRAEDSRLRFAVADRGLGIPRSELERVFEKFYRLDPNMTRGIGGTGLGLYITRELVRMMRGKIWVESQEGEGSTFYVEIPLAEQQRRTRPARTRAASGA